MKKHELNSIEKSIVNQLNGITSQILTWKLFSSRYVYSNMELKSEREKKLYEFLCEYLKDSKNMACTMINTKKFKSLFIQWSNGKLIESVSLIVTEKEIDKALKYYFKENHLTLNRYFGLAMNNDENDKNVYIVSLCRESGIYVMKEPKEEDGKSEDSALDKISVLLNSVNSLTKELSASEKKEVAAQLYTMAQNLGVVGNVTKKTKEEKIA